MSARTLPAHWVLVCEGPSDARVVQTLVDRVLHAHGDDWVREEINEKRAHNLRQWVALGEGASYVDRHQLATIARSLGLPMLRGRFDKVASADAVHGEAHGERAVVRAFQIAAQLARTQPIAGLVVLWDADQEPEARRNGTQRGVAIARALLPRLPDHVLALCVPELEAWLIAGFDPQTDAEHRRFAEVRSRVHADPRTAPERLTSKRPTDPRDAKALLDLLTDGDGDRAHACCADTSLDHLHERGERSGLREFLDDVARVMVPHVDPRAAGARGHGTHTG